MAALTPKQAEFVRQYLIDLNATQAAIRAGYAFKESAEGPHVYLLIDPRDASVFYVGKGTGRRRFHHLLEARSDRHSNSVKVARIRAIWAGGLKPRIEVFSNCRDDREAFAVERALLVRLHGTTLTNIQSGTVTAEEGAAELARQALLRLKSFEQWVLGLDYETEMLAVRIFGDVRSAYEEIWNGLWLTAYRR